MTPEELMDHIKSMEKETRKLKEQIFDICYFMKGGVELDSAWALSFADRDLIISHINKRLKEENPNAPDYM